MIVHKLNRWLLPGVMLLIGALSVFAQDTPYFEDNACPIAAMSDRGVRCGTLFVPENRQVEGSYVIELAVAILPSTAANPAPDPVIYLEGGPGGSALINWEDWMDSALRQRGDLILIDQRGTGYSSPTLDCVELNDLDEDNPTAACRERLVNDGIDIAAYNSAENADDIADLIVALGLEEANLLGSSYGTRLALTVLRDRPERIRSAIIEAVYPPNVNGLDDQAIYGHQAFEKLFANCAADAACNAAYPNLRNVFYDTLAMLNESPLELEEEGDLYDYGGAELINEIFGLMYDVNAIPMLPGLIYAASDGDPDTFMDFSADYYDALDSGLIGDSGDDEYEETSPLDSFLIDYLDMNSVDDLESYLGSLSDDEFNSLYDEIFESDEFLVFIAEYAGLSSSDEAADYLDNLSDDAYFDLMDELEGSGDEADRQYPDELLDEAEQDDFMDNEDFVDGDSEGMFNSVECGEDVPFNSMAAAEELARDIPALVREPLLDSVASQFDDCALWNVPAQPAFENEAVRSDIPVLIFSGEYDPITPPEWGDIAAQTLPNSYHYVLPGMGHGAVDLRPCPTEIAMSFLANPMQQPADGCHASMPGADFYIPGN